MPDGYMDAMTDTRRASWWRRLLGWWGRGATIEQRERDEPPADPSPTLGRPGPPRHG
jgi:hypothetical protein